MKPESHGHDPEDKFVLFLVESHDEQFVLPDALQVRHEISQAYDAAEAHKATPLSE